MIYLDNNATSRPLPQVVAAMTQCLDQVWGNPASSHACGQQARRALSDARCAVARLLGALPVEVVFTSGATEANHAVLRGALERSPPRALPPLLVLSAIEHAAMLKAARHLADSGLARLRLMPVDRLGRVDVDAAATLIEPGTALVSLIAANNETGVIQPVDQIAALARAAAAPMHLDATQVAGRLPFDFAALGVDLASVSAHKLHGPKGCGALLVRKGLQWPALQPGAQERGRRGGTENLPGIVGFGIAAALAEQDLGTALQSEQRLRDSMEQQLSARLPLRIYGAGAARLPNTSYLRIAEFDADLVLNRLERHQIACASGSACSSGGAAPSHVLLAMGVDAQEAMGAIRISLSRQTTVSEIDTLIETLCAELLPRLERAA
jgi:cysteine desulfurase